MKYENLAEILMRQGLVTPDQVQRALDRKKTRGGKLGSHLLYYRFVSEEQLVRALSEQQRVPGVCLAGQRIPDDVTRRLPVALVDEYQMLPFAWSPETNTLSVAMADPENSSALQHARRAAGGSLVQLHVAVESVLRSQIAAHYHSQGREVFVDQIIELPALFAEDASVAAALPADGGAPPALRVLMVSRTAFLRSFLVAIFEREGIELQLMSDPQEIAAAMRDGKFDHVLVAKDMETQFADWGRAGIITPPRAEVSVFSNVSSALLDNPAPYRDVVGALLRSLQQMANLRCAGAAYVPAYVDICDDLRTLATAVGFRRVAVDGLQIAAHLLVPAPDFAAVGEAGRAPTGESPHAQAFALADFERSIEIAQALRFPWDVAGCLAAFADLTDVAHARRDTGHAVPVAAQLLALVWYRYAVFAGRDTTVDDVKAELGRQVGRLASADVVETYSRILEQGATTRVAASQDPVLLVGTRTEVSQQLAVHLRYGGYRILECPDLEQAAALLAQAAPSIIIVDHHRYKNLAVEFCRTAKEQTPALVYAFTTHDNPQLVLDLMDAGFDDAFAPPFNYNLIVTRISKALEARGRRAETERGFRGSLQELPFVDLVQALSASQRTVQVQLQNPTGERANLVFRHGQIVHAVCGTLTGPDAVYRLIGWRDQGSFVTAAVKTFPADNVRLPTDSLLFEGCRLLDESR